MNFKHFLILLVACLLLAVHASRSGRNEGNLPRADDAPQDPEPTPAVRRHDMIEDDAQLAGLKRNRLWIIISLVLSEAFLIGADFVGSNWPHIFTGRGHVLLIFSHLIVWLSIITVGVWGWTVEREIAEHSFRDERRTRS